MIRFLSAFILLILVMPALPAQSTAPAISQPLPNQTVALGGNPVTMDLRNYFALPGVTGQVAQFDTVLGKVNVELLSSDAPLNVANFLNYVNRGAYTNSFIHRSVPGFVIQGGGFVLQGNSVNAIASDTPVHNEFKISNTRGTLAMAKTAAGPDSATNQWFFNLGDNRHNVDPTTGQDIGLDVQNGGFTVFARVLGTGMTVVDAIAAVPTYDERTSLGADFSQLPLLTGNLTAADLILIRSISTVPIYPTSGASSSVLSFAVQNSNAATATATLNQSNLAIAPSSTATGTTTITITATDTNGNAASGAFAVTVAATATPPVITTPPASQQATPGSSVTLTVVASGPGTFGYQWKKDDVAIAGATGATYTITSAQLTDAGNYTVVVSNAAGSVTSAIATLTVGNARLSAISCRAVVGAGGDVLIPGIIIGGSGPKQVIVRASGPALISQGVTGTLAQPQLRLYSGSTVIAESIGWSSGTAANTSALQAAFTQAGLSQFPPGSADCAVLATLMPGVYTAIISGVNNSTGVALVEVYELGTGSSQLSAISCRAVVGAGGNVLIPGIIVNGSGQNRVLVRASGPALIPQGVTGTLAQPQLRLYSGSTVIAENIGWSSGSAVDTTALQTAVTQVGLTPFPAGSADCALLATLTPGAYTAIISGVNSTTGVALIEVYEMP